ncbi:MAG: transposase [Saccharospirillum sp.]
MGLSDQSTVGIARNIPTATKLTDHVHCSGPSWAMHEILRQQYISSFKTGPTELFLDFNATNNPVHGEQVSRYFNGFDDEYCILSLLDFCGYHLLRAYLRPASLVDAYNAPVVLPCWVTRLRQQWPQVRIVVRADAGFCRPLLMYWCGRNRENYVIAMTNNSVLLIRSHSTQVITSPVSTFSSPAARRLSLTRSPTVPFLSSTGAALDCQSRAYRPRRQPTVPCDHTHRRPETLYTFGTCF